MLAVLIDHRGAYVDSRTAITCLWPDEGINDRISARYRKTLSRLEKELAEEGIAYIIEGQGGRRRIKTNALNCDFYTYLEDPNENRSPLKGLYMEEYEWSEFTSSEINIYERIGPRGDRGSK